MKSKPHRDKNIPSLPLPKVEEHAKTGPTQTQANEALTKGNILDSRGEASTVQIAGTTKPNVIVVKDEESHSRGGCNIFDWCQCCMCLLKIAAAAGR
jgi:hypothetical protein